MSILDDARAMRESDPGGMHRHLEGFAAQIREALAIGREAPLGLSTEEVSSIVVLGMGGSAIGGELASGYLADELAVPFQVVRNYSLPGYVGPSTLAIVSSYSGNTEETLSAYREATSRGARVVCSTTGGEVSRLAEANGHALIRIPPGLPPRAALGYGFVPLVVVLSRLGLIPDPGEEIESAARVAEKGAVAFGLDSPLDANAAKELAAWLHGHIPVVYGTAPRTAVIANRWAGQFSENSKVVAHRNELPEMNHNEIVGWSAERPLAGDARVVFLRDADDDPRVSRRIDITRVLIGERGVPVRDVESFGESRLARLFSLVVLGDFVSYYLALLTGTDPTPVAPIDRLKKALAES